MAIKKYIVVYALIMTSGPTTAQVWLADQGNGTYRNPILHADYSDPDACRVGEDYYMTASSFDAVPGLPLLHSKDLVNWSLVGHALPRQPPYDHFAKTQHGNGVWAPAIRHHDGKFYIYYPDPDFGIYVTIATQIGGPWSEPVLVEAGKGLIDPCPLWDDDGKVYLAYAYAGSRAGIKSILAIKRLSPDGTHALDVGTLVYDGHGIDPTIEGPKLYKRNGYYYIFAPAGGVSTGWQLVLRARNIYGPYERRVVMDQGTTTINGPHQGAWVNTPTGEDWFLHFQDKGPYGRVVHLQPMQWRDDWPVIGIDKDGDGKGEPVLAYRKPTIGKTKVSVTAPPESDNFNTAALGPQWQWQANPEATWSFLYPAKGVLRLYAASIPADARNYWDVPNILLQKFPAEEFTITTKLTFSPHPTLPGEATGLVIYGQAYAALALRNTPEGVYLVQTHCADAPSGKPETEKSIVKMKDNTVYLRVSVAKEARCRFSYSTDGTTYTPAGEVFQAEPGRWIGAKAGIFCTRTRSTNDAGYADFDWFTVTPVKP
ncbi:glycoside hydrolase 43 family protein [Fulvivirgaceae bacterium PWU5]|uniref:Glycoside hydrolase 43 family protein n=1 Tax=Dawidia cretensis TaxID=2782350 RepID=A0AAP2E2W9_9BACT|nr:glycoside hydrolase 43 family protein [Dawidia cretensis]MBT1711048.1 glycoside hydrolase 43 family protein [Dawidia cretensis]